MIECLMSMNLPLELVNHVIGTIALCNHIIPELEKENRNQSRNDKWEYCDVIPILPLLGVNHGSPIFPMSNAFLY